MSRAKRQHSLYSDVRHAMFAVGAALDKASYGDTPESDLLETHATLDSLMPHLKDYEVAVDVLERMIAANEGLELNGAEDAIEVLRRLRSEVPA